MGVFGLFKSKKQREMDAATLKETLSRIFPTGKQDLVRDCQRVASLIKDKLQGDELLAFVTRCKAAIAVNTEAGDARFDDDGFVRDFFANAKQKITESEAREVYVYLAGESMYHATIVWMAKQQGNDIPPGLLDHIQQLRAVWAKGTNEDCIPGGYGDFGLTVTNPVPTVCVAGSKYYLSRLRRDSRPVDNKRVGSTSSPVTAGSVDVYQLSQEGREICTIHICPYHRKDSKLAPSGFSLTDVRR
jgi:hypothetical protein